MDKDRLTIFTSAACNNNCIFCSDRKPDLSFKNAAWLTPEGFLKQSKKIVSLDSMLFTTCEPTLNKDLSHFIKLAKQKGYKHICLQTNGRLLSYGSYVDELVKAGLTEVNISVHGSSKKIHEALTRTPGGYAQTIQGLKNMIALKDIFRLKVNTCSTLTRLNYKDLYPLMRMLLSFEKIDCIILNTLMYAGNAERFFNQLFVSYSDIANEFKKAINKLRRLYGCRKELPIKIEAMPFCLMAGYENYVGIPETPYYIKDKEKTMLPRSSVTAKTSICASCRYYKVCSGVDIKYAEKIGWFELNSIK